MNYGAMVRKHLRGLEAVYGEMPERAKAKAREEMAAAFGRMGYGPEHGNSVLAETAVIVSATVNGEPIAVAVTKPEDALLTAMKSDQVVLEPVSDHAHELPATISKEEPKVEGDVNGSSGTFYHDTVTVTTPQPAEEIGGWPVLAEVAVIGLAPNRRSLKGKVRLAGGAEKIVSVERKIGIPAGVTVKGRLMRAGISPLYRVVA